MASAYLLSEEDRQKLQKLLGEHGMTRLDHSEQNPIPGSPEVYIAKVKADPGSIPALIPAGTDDYDHPGCAPCDIYKIMPSSSAEDWDLTAISNLSVPVYNLTSSDIGDEWLLVIRDKAGDWIAVRSGGGCRFYIGTTIATVTSGTGFTVSNLAATDGGPIPDPDNASPDTWNVENAAAGGDGYNIDSDTTGKIIGYADGTLHPLDFPCPA